MCPDDSLNSIDSFALTFIRRKVRQMIGCAGFSWHDQEDLEQDLISHFLKANCSFDPGKAHPNAFATTVIQRFVINLLRNKRAKKRDHRRARSLDPTSGDVDGRYDRQVRRGQCTRAEDEMAELVMDTAEMLSRLPGPLRDLAERLMHDSVTNVARDMGIPRTTIYTEIARLRRRFEKTGLKDYMGRDSVR